MSYTPSPSNSISSGSSVQFTPGSYQSSVSSWGSTPGSNGSQTLSPYSQRVARSIQQGPGQTVLDLFNENPNGQYGTMMGQVPIMKQITKIQEKMNKTKLNKKEMQKLQKELNKIHKELYNAQQHLFMTNYFLAQNMKQTNKSKTSKK
jgi:hypothetical protein